MSKATQTVPTWSTSGLVATLLAIDAINNKTDNIFDNILPNTTIVYEIFDSKQDTVTAAKIAPQLLQAFEGKGADIVLGAGTSGVSMALQSILKYFDTAQVSPSATSGYLSIATDFPFFARIIPTDGVLTDAMIQFAKHIVGWKSCAIVSGNDPYSVYGGTALRNAADLHNLEVSSFEIFSSGTNDMSVPISNAVQSGARLFFYFGLMTDLYTFQKTLHKYLTIRGDIEEGFSIIYPKITKATLEALEKEFKSLNEQHIFDTVINASYTVKITIRGGGMSERFQTLFKNAIQSNIDCFNKNVSGACSDCLGKKINPLTNLPIFHYEKQPNKPKICIAPNSGSGIGYYPQFNFDSVLMIANAYHKIIETNKAVTFGKDDFMTTVTSPSFSFYGATGFVKLDDKGDRLRDGISFDIGKMKISSTFYNVSSKNLLYKVGTLHIRGESPKFEFCKVNSSGALNTCDPSISFNTKDNSRPDPIDSSILRINLGIVTSTFHATAPYKVDTSGGQRTLAILVAIDEINNLKSTLRRRYFNSTPRIVYKWKNSGRSMPHAAAAASYLIGGTAFENHALVDVAIGAFSSGPSISMQSIMKSNNILQISPSSTSTSFSDKLKYPTFARTIPSDVSVSQVLVKFVKTTLDWQEISIISSDTDYASSGMTCIINEAKKANLMISANIVVQHNTEKSMYQESINALKAGNRAFIVFLHSSDILLLAKAMEKAAKFLQIDVSNICFVFTETILGLIGSESLPVILNGSFALKSQNGQNHDLHKAMFQNIHNKIASAKSCQSHDPAKTLCDCIEKEWRYIFFIDHDYDTSTPKKCGFPSTINVDDYYVPFAYDAVLTVAKLYDYIISRKKLDVIGEGVLKETLFSSKIEFEGATGSVKFTSVGDRIVEDMQFRVLNIYNDAKAQNNSIGNTSIYMNNANLLKTVGTITLAESFAHCTPSVKNETSGMAVMRCVPRLVYSTKDGKHPTSVVKACKINLDCGETGLCLSNGQCQCAPGRVGINCQQKLFSKREEYTNNDGSERCLKFIAPRSINTENSTFYSANAEKFLVVNVPSSVAFKRTKLFKYVPEKVHPTVRDFVSHFKVSKKSIHGLLSTYYSKHQNVFQVACDFLKVDANLQTMLSYIPTSQMDKPLRIANNINSVSSNVITKLLQILCEEYLQTKVSVIRSSSDLESMDRLGGDKLDLIAEVLLKKTDKDTDVGSSQYDFRVIGPFSQRHLYLNIPKSFKIIEDSVNHWLYSDTLVSHLPPVGTFPSDVDACTLWFCNQGRYTPTHCMGSNSNGCGEILISTGFRLFPEKMSILIEMIQNLNLPFVINFVTNDVLALALSNEQYVIAFFSCDTCLDTKHFSVDLPYISLPEISKSCETSTDTTYEYDRKILGAYNCDFPVAFTHTVAKKNLYETFPAVHTLIKRMRLTNDDITTMSIFMNATFVDRDLTLSVRNWMSNKEQVWSKWMIGCINVPGKYGVEGKCKSCPPGTFSSMGSNICTPCFKGTFTLELNREKCFNCPSNTVSEPGMHGLGACKCMEQIGNATVGCRLCPLHGLCKLGSLSVMNGFWRFNKTSEEIFKCRLMEACLGASIPSSREIEFYGENEAHNESCLNGHYGILCDTCLPDYTKDFNGFCHMCDRSWVTIFFNVVTVLLLIAGVYFLMRLFVNSEPNIDGFHAQIKNFRELKNYDHACMYFRDYKVNSMRLFDYSSKTSDKTSNMEKRKFTRQVSKHNVFSITSERTTQSDAKIAEVALPKKIIISESIEEYKELQSCIYHKNPKSFLETDKIYSNLFKDEIKEIAVAPITTDLNEVRGIFIVAIAKENKICLHEDLKSIEDFVKSHEDDWSSQSESILSSLIKILISHFQIFASMKHIILPWDHNYV
eukprot:g6480.t1